MILLFVVGYLFIALEHKTKIDKSAVALLMAGAIWTVFSLLGNDPKIQHELVDQLGDTCEILVFLIGAMTIVDLIDSYGGFGRHHRPHHHAQQAQADVAARRNHLLHVGGTG